MFTNLIAIFSGRKCFHSSDNLIDTAKLHTISSCSAVYMDEDVEVEISQGSSTINNSQFYAPPEVQVAAAIVSNGPIMTMSSIR